VFWIQPDIIPIFRPERRRGIVKSQVSPITAIIAVLVVVGIAAFAWIRFSSGGAGSKAGEQPPGIPPDAAASLQRVMGGKTTPSTPGGMQGIPPGVMPGAAPGANAPNANPVPGGR
jgi:hypothetical protein